MFLTSERLSIVEYISSPTPTRSKFVFQQPKLSYENNLFLLSFNYSLWYGSIALICILYLVICLVTVWEWKQKKSTKKIESGVLRPNVIDVALFTFGAACQQGSTVELKGALGRMVLLLLFVALTFLYTSYSANIVALLQSSSSQIRTLEDLLHSRIKFGVHDTVFNRHYFKTETEPVRRAIYKTKVAPPGTEPRFISMEKGVKEMKKGLFAFHMETGVGYKFVGKYFEEGEKCGLKEIQYLRVIDPWLAVRKNTQFMEMFKIGVSTASEWKLESFGTWSAKQGLNKTNDMSVEITMRRKNLGGLPIAASLVITSNETKKQLFNLRDLHIDFITKASFRQLDPLYYFLNASRVLIFTDNWGYIINGSYNGMIGDIVREVAELTGTVVFITKQRLKVLDYLSYPTSTTVKFVFRQPSLSYENNLFILPFKPRVWFCIFGLIVLMLLIVFINARWESIKYEPDTLDKTFLKPNLSEIALMVIGAITQQGSYTELKGTLGRVVMFLMFLAFLFLYTSYSANIVALLQSSSNQINTLADLLNSKLELGVEETPYNRHHFLAATDPIKKAIYEKKIVPRGYKPNFMSLEEGVRRLQKKPFAFNMFLGGGYKLVEKYFLEHEKCDLEEIEYIEENKPWLACRKKSPLKEMYKIGLFRNQEHGLNSRVNFLIYAKKPTCIVHGGTFDSVNMTDFYPALLMLAYGTILALILLLLEIFHWRQFRMINT
ncbi:ionotropic receptor 75a-like [Vanessa tameamea]|uniref:Ionotropic receptor 75a-like n=1 Tax=Vanessa tameamea TaxID=334116 RepID=A0ABM4AKP7_VANTA